MLYFVLVLFFAASAFAASFFTESVANADGFSAEGKSAYLVDATTGRELYAKNENERLPVASMVKLMTVLLTLEAEERGELSYDEDITVSERAASMGGSQIFLDAGSVHKAGDLLKSVIIASANDSCVALAERIGGSVEGFVESMNARARELGMQNTNFANCTGFPRRRDSLRRGTWRCFLKRCAHIPNTTVMRACGLRITPTPAAGRRP